MILNTCTSNSNLFVIKCTLFSFYTTLANALLHVVTDPLTFIQSDYKIEGISPEEISRNSAMSRASLRNQHKEVLHSLKASAEDRRSKSPGILSVRSQKSVLSDLELDENGDMPFPSDESKGKTE